MHQTRQGVRLQERRLRGDGCPVREGVLQDRDAEMVDAEGVVQGRLGKGVACVGEHGVDERRGGEGEGGDGESGGGGG